MASDNIILATVAPGPFRADNGALPGTGRDGKAITAGIAPSWADRAFDIGDSLVELARQRLAQKDNPTRKQARSSIVTQNPKNTLDDASPGLLSDPVSLFARPAFAGLNVGQVVGIAIVGVVAVVLLRKHRR